MKRVVKCLGKLVGISAPSPAYFSVQGYDACNDLLNVKDEGENRKGHELFTILTIKTERKKKFPSFLLRITQSQ